MVAACVTPKIREQHKHQPQAITHTKWASDGAAHTCTDKQQNHTTHARQQRNKNKVQHTAHRPPRPAPTQITLAQAAGYKFADGDCVTICNQARTVSTFSLWPPAGQWQDCSTPVCWSLRVECASLRITTSSLCATEWT
jgi:hypothetical protein